MQIACLSYMLATVVSTVVLMNQSFAHLALVQLSAVVIIASGVFAAALLVAYSLQEINR